VTARSDLGQNW